MSRPLKYQLTKQQEQTITLLYQRTLLTVNDIVDILGFPFRLVNCHIMKTFNTCRRKQRVDLLRIKTGYYKSVPIPVEFQEYYPGKCMSEHLLVYLRATNTTYLPVGYSIYHKNGVRDDNRLENLQLVSDAGLKTLKKAKCYEAVSEFWPQINIARLQNFAVTKTPEQEAKEVEEIKATIRARNAAWCKSHYRKG